MIRNLINLFLSFLIFIIDNPVFPNEISQKAIDNYNLKISRKFSNTYCNTIKFGISKEGALEFSKGETSKEFSNNKFNKFIDYQMLNKNILLGLKNNCQIYDFSVNDLENLVFK